MNLPQINLTTAAVATIAYSWFAVRIVHTARRTNSGVFITLNGMVSFLVTFPAAVSMGCFGRKFNFRSNCQMTTAIATCAVLTFAIVFGMMNFV